MSNKLKIVAAVAEALGIPHKEADKVVDKVCQCVTDALCQEEGKVMLPGVGILERKTRAARSGRNPHTGEMLQIPATTVVRFKTATKLKEAVKNVAAEVKPAKAAAKRQQEELA